MDDTLRKLALSGGYSPEAFRFLFESLEHTLVISGKVKAEGPERHITGQELLDGMRQHARRIFGPLAVQIWKSWGIHCSLDWGRIVFLLVEAGLLNSQKTDRLEDFDEEFDYEKYFVEDYRPEVGGALGESS
jgi:uncharacterized repeat protein (TIGR04138 family)